jgi:ABC-type lipoprotein export system ATPase subunit
MTDRDERIPEAEIIDLPAGAGRNGDGPPGGAGTALGLGPGPATGDATTDEPGRRGGRPRSGLGLPGSRQRAVVRAGDGRQIACEGLVRIYKVADLEVVALQGLDLVVGVGEMIAIVGASGSGKSTLLNILGGLDTPSAGRAVVAGHDLGTMGRRERTRYRRRVVGMIWQQTARNLLPYLTAQENVELPMTLDGRPDRAARAKRLLELVGLADRRDHRPERLSGGEQQRVAIAVALANEPEVLFADEPTGELDTTTSSEIFGLLRRVNEELGTTIVIVTHDPLVSEQVQRTVAIRDGRTSTETVRRRHLSETGEHTLISEEFAVLDRAGRLQLPKAHVAALGLKDRVRLRLEDDHVEIWPDTGSLVHPTESPRREEGQR